MQQKKKTKEEQLRREAESRLEESMKQIHHMNEASKKILSRAPSRRPSLVEFSFGHADSAS